MQRALALVTLCAFLLAPSQALAHIVISEVLWMGSDLSTADEWLELASFDTTEPQSLSGWTITSFNGTQDTIIARFGPMHVLQPGGFGIVSNFSASQSRLALDPLFVTSSLSLPNTKLRLRLRDASGALVDEVDDGIGTPFAGMNSTGSPKASMERINLSGSGAVKANWRTAETVRGFDAGVIMRGTPGYENGTMEASSSSSTSSEFSTSSIHVQPLWEGKIFISEVMPDPVGSDEIGEWLELVAEGGAVDLSGWSLQSGTAKYVFPAGSILASGSYLLLMRPVSKISLPNAGGSVLLWNAEGQQHDAFVYGQTQEGVSWGRVQGAVEPRRLCRPSPGEANTMLSSASVTIDIQQGRAFGEGAVSLNLQAKVAGDVTGVQCRWDYGDGYTSASCNPPSHTFEQPGHYIVRLEAVDHCSNTMVHTLPVLVRKKNDAASQKCLPSSFSGLVLSEILPNPQERDEEWIELFNPRSQLLHLCGWQLDDGEGGSAPFSLGEYTVMPESYLLLPASHTKIAYNDTGDHVRLIAPLSTGGTGVLVDTVYDDAPEGVSLLSLNGAWQPSRYPTPGGGNTVLPQWYRWEWPHIAVQAALPNPEGKDEGLEWVEVENLSGRPQHLQEWRLETMAGARWSLDGLVLAAGERRRMYPGKAWSIPNTDTAILLKAPNGTAVSLLAWASAKEGAVLSSAPATGRRVAVTLEAFGEEGEWIVRTDDGKLREIPPPFVDRKGNIKNILESYRTLMHKQKFDLLLYSNNEHKDTVHDIRWRGKSLRDLLLAEGLITTTRDEFLQEPVAAAWEQLASTERKGLWADARMHELQNALREEWKLAERLRKGHVITASVRSGIVASGQLLSFKSPVKSLWYASKNGGSYEEFSGSLLVDMDISLKVYAVPILPNGRAEYKLKSPILRRDFLLKKEHYPSTIMVSEVHASPAKGDGEWIELYNASRETVALGGWIVERPGKQARTLPIGMKIEPGEYKVLPKALTKITLPNNGGRIVLRSPDGKVKDRVVIPKLKTGVSHTVMNLSSALYDKENIVSKHERKWCLGTPTPMLENECATQVMKKKKAAKSSKRKSKKVVQKKGMGLEGGSGLTALRGQLVGEVLGIAASHSGFPLFSFVGFFCLLLVALGVYVRFRVK